MTIVTCPTCKKEYRINNDMTGKKVKCRNCDTVFTIGLELLEDEQQSTNIGQAPRHNITPTVEYETGISSKITEPNRQSKSNPVVKTILIFIGLFAICFLGVYFYGYLSSQKNKSNAGIKTQPQNSKAYYNLGNALDNKNDHDGAITAHRQAIKTQPQNAEDYYNLGLVLYGKGDHDGAVTAFKQATKINPNFAEAYYVLGVVLCPKGDHDGAITAFRQAIKINPNLADAYCTLGFVLGCKGDYEGAITSIKQAIQINHKDTLAYSMLIDLYLHTHDLPKAKELFKQAKLNGCADGIRPEIRKLVENNKD